MPAWRSEAQIGPRLTKGLLIGEAGQVVSQPFLARGRGGGRLQPSPGGTQRIAPFDLPPGEPRARPLPHRRAQREHRRDQHHRIGRDAARCQRGQRDEPAHRMPQHDMRPLPRPYPIGIKGRQILNEIVEPVDMPGPIDRQPPRPALPAPVERGHIPPLRAELVDRLAIFLDHVGASCLEQQPPPPRRIRRTRPIIAAMHPAIGRDPARQKAG